eukprot:scaffold141986_cov29-Tisochrysis_lutea.AAC.2
MNTPGMCRLGHLAAHGAALPGYAKLASRENALKGQHQLVLVAPRPTVHHRDRSRGRARLRPAAPRGLPAK